MAKIPRVNIAGVIAKHTLENGSSPEYAKEVAAYLMSERRVQGLDSILRDVMDDWAKAGYLEVLAYSASPLTPALKAEIVECIKDVSPNVKNIVVTEQRDPDVMGGVRLQLANRRLDLSVEDKLNKFKQLIGAGKE